MVRVYTGMWCGYLVVLTSAGVVGSTGVHVLTAMTTVSSHTLTLEAAFQLSTVSTVTTRICATQNLIPY